MRKDKRRKRAWYLKKETKVGQSNSCWSASLGPEQKERVVYIIFDFVAVAILIVVKRSEQGCKPASELVVLSSCIGI